MTARPTLALLIPAYNAAAFLPRLLKSAAAQDPPFDEIVVHDDCSTDETAKVALAFGARVVRSNTNIGCTAGKARLLGETSAEWVHFHDADDELLAEFTATVQEALTSPPQVEVIIVGTEERHEENSSHLAVAVPNAALLRESPLLFSIAYKVNAISGVYRRSFLVETRALEIPDNERYNEDQAIQLNLVLARARFKCIPRILTRSFVQSASMSRSNQLKCLASHYCVMKRALGALPCEYDDLPYKSAIATRLWAVAAGAAAERDYELADEASQLARRIAKIPETAGGALFRSLAMLDPGLSLRLREESIRLFKPHLRRL